MPAGKPDAEVEVEEALVRQLLSDQHPDLARLKLTHLDSGWDNVIFRLGDEFTVRVPRREIAAGLLVNEQTWLPTLADQLPVPIPAPVRLGTPTAGYPWHWSVLPWFEGACADESPIAAGEADRFADFLIRLHQPAPESAPANPVRGVPLSVRVENTGQRMARLETSTDLLTPELRAIWERALAAPEASEARWLHGDLHAQNVLVVRGRISAIIDWGDLTAGDVATDLAGIWSLFEDGDARRAILDRYGPDPATLARARGWAFLFGVVLLDSGQINSPRHAAAGRQTLLRLQEDSTT